MATPTFKNEVAKFPQEILAGIGEIVAQWGYLHHQLGVIVREVCGLPKATGRVLTIGAEVGVICGIISALTRDETFIKDAGIRSDLAALGEDVKKNSIHRNAYAHGVFGIGETPGTFVRILMHSPANRINPDEEQITVDSLKKIAVQAHELWVRAQDITTRLKA